MKIVFRIMLLCLIFGQCKTKDELHHHIKQEQQTISKNKNTSGDTIICQINDTVLVTLPVQFTTGRLWNAMDTLKELSLYRQDETQKYEQDVMNDYQQFHYVTKDTGRYLLKYQLKSPFIKDTTIYRIVTKYFIIKS